MPTARRTQPRLLTPRSSPADTYTGTSLAELDIPCRRKPRGPSPSRLSTWTRFDRQCLKPGVPSHESHPLVNLHRHCRGLELRWRSEQTARVQTGALGELGATHR